MAQKVIDVVGTSTESFAKAAENAVVEAAKTDNSPMFATVTFSMTSSQRSMYEALFWL